MNACDVPAKFAALKEEFSSRVCYDVFKQTRHVAKDIESQKNVSILEDGHLVSRCSDWIVYNVEAENIDRVVKEYGKCECGCLSVLMAFHSLYGTSNSHRRHRRRTDLVQSA